MAKRSDDLRIQIRSATIAWASSLALCLLGLIVTRPPFHAENGLTIYLGKNAEYLPFLPLLLLIPLAAMRPMVFEPGRELLRRVQAWATAKPTFDMIAVLAIAAVALWGARHIAGLYEVTVPNYHDEFSYLFQAKTFASGHLTAKGFPERPELFDQMHVLSGDRMTSRYFPGTAFWMVPFVIAGVPWFGHQIAHVICAVGLYFCGRELSGRLAGMVAGILFALSPGLLVFSNLLLAHHPTLVGLVLFLWAYLRWMNKQSRWLLIASGAGLSFAMLCRPMTAAAFALPFGVHFAAHLLSSKSPSPQRIRDCLAMATPLLAGFVVMAVYNQATTGSLLTTPYQIYTDRHTPRHVYGFANGTRGEAAITGENFDPRRRMEAYDDWAINLTPRVAAENAAVRVESSLRLTLGVIPLAFVGVFWLANARRRPRGEQLLAWSILSLHLAHIPYWFSGIMHWHYVMESSLCWLLLTGVATQRLVRLAQKTNADLTVACWASVLTVAVFVNLVTYLPVLASEADVAASQINYGKGLYAAFFRDLANITQGRPALVLVRPDDSTPQIDYVINEPGLDSQVIIGRLRPDDDVNAIAAFFPARDIFVFDVAARQVEQIRPALRR